MTARKVQGSLELRQDPGGWRHYIDGIAIHCGDPIDAMMQGEWYEGRYEASWQIDKRPSAVFYYVDRAGDRRAVRINETTVVRLPLSARERLGL